MKGSCEWDDAPYVGRSSVVKSDACSSSKISGSFDAILARLALVIRFGADEQVRAGGRAARVRARGRRGGARDDGGEDAGLRVVRGGTP